MDKLIIKWTMKYVMRMRPELRDVDRQIDLIIETLFEKWVIEADEKAKFANLLKRIPSVDSMTRTRRKIIEEDFKSWKMNYQPSEQSERVSQDRAEWARVTRWNSVIDNI